MLTRGHPVSEMLTARGTIQPIRISLRKNRTRTTPPEQAVGPKDPKAGVRAVKGGTGDKGTPPHMTQISTSQSSAKRASGAIDSPIKQTASTRARIATKPGGMPGTYHVPG